MYLILVKPASLRRVMHAADQIGPVPQPAHYVGEGYQGVELSFFILVIMIKLKINSRLDF